MIQFQFSMNHSFERFRSHSNIVSFQKIEENKIIHLNDAVTFP